MRADSSDSSSILDILIDPNLFGEHSPIEPSDCTEKDVTLLRLDDMITKLRHEDAVAGLRKVALELVDASFD
jgi:hypothetical protein